MNKSNVIHIGRFAFIIPFIVMPLFAMLKWNYDLLTALLLTVFLPMGIESPIIVLYPLSWITSIVCFILCKKEYKALESEELKRKGKIKNRVLLGVALVVLVIWIALVVGFILNFNLTF